jgi:hypothetical protein
VPKRRKNLLGDVMPSTAEILGALHRAGWSIGDTAFHTADGRLVYVVLGRNGENRIRAEGATPAEAWRGAAEQARLLGMLGTGQRTGEPFET